MLVGSARHMVCVLWLFGWTLSAWAIDPPRNAKIAPAQPVVPVVVKERAGRPAVSSGPNDPAELRAEVEKSLKELAEVSDKDLTPIQKSLRVIWNKRVDLLDEWDKAAKGRQLLENPLPSPEREASDRKAELERARNQLELLKKSPEAVLPEPFKRPADQVDDATLVEMREAIEVAKIALKEKTTESEKLRAEPSARTTSLSDSRTARDKIHTEVTELPTLRLQAESAIFKAPNEEARKIAREEFINLKCRSGLASERLQMTEAQIALEVRRGATCEVATQAAQANVELATATLAALTDRYKWVAERQKATLTRAAKTEEKRGDRRRSARKFKAHRTAELLSLQALNLEDDKALSTNPRLSLEEQRSLADRAEADFASLKQVVKENRLGGLVALRLNNDFRRISRERAILVRNELAQSSAANTTMKMPSPRLS